MFSGKRNENDYLQKHPQARVDQVLQVLPYFPKNMALMFNFEINVKYVLLYVTLWYDVQHTITTQETTNTESSITATYRERKNKKK